MNFQNVPELGTHYGYLVVFAVLGAATSMLAYRRRKDMIQAWFGGVGCDLLAVG